MTYNIETIIAEKFQTIISRSILNSRMKDYYDLYYLLDNKEFSNENLKEAIKKTFSKRNTEIENIDKVIAEIEKSDFVKDLWTNYVKKHIYAENINFKDIIKAIEVIKNYI